MLLLCIALGSVCGMPAAGVVTARFGTARTVAAMSVVYVAGLTTVALSVTHGSVGVAIGFYVLGLGNGMWDVAMNVQGAHVERGLGRSIMSRFHAGFSVGTVAGAAIGAVMVATNVSVRVHLLVIAAAILAVVPLSVRGFLPDAPQHHEHTEGGKRRTFAAWTEPRTVLIGVFVLCMAFTEGTGNDWLSIAMIDGYDTTAGCGHCRIRGLPDDDDARSLVRTGESSIGTDACSYCACQPLPRSSVCSSSSSVRGTHSRCSVARCGASVRRWVFRPESALLLMIRVVPLHA